MEDIRGWADAEFGDVAVNDTRLAHRLVSVAARVAASPSGVVAKVFREPCERQATYDLLGNDRLSSSAVIAAVARATARRCDATRVVYLPIDGTSATLADEARTKELGAIGARCFGTRGLKIVDVCAVDERGVSLGLVGLSAWARGPARGLSKYHKRQSLQTEMAQHWIPALKTGIETLLAEGVDATLWIVGDRECDDAFFLQAANDLGRFTVRAAQDRVVEVKGKRRKLMSAASRGRLMTPRHVEVSANGKRLARSATLDIRVAKMSLMLSDRANTNKRQPLPVTVVTLRERGNRSDRISWTLITNAQVTTEDDVTQIIASYRARWRIEEFHRAWKAGACDLESTQLRSRDAIIKWATILGTVAARAERLKLLSRKEPETPASVEFSDLELYALILAKRRIKTSVETVPNGVPSLKLATRWVAELGGWAGHYKKYDPGATTIARGLEYLAMWSQAVGALADPREIKRTLR